MNINLNLKPAVFQGKHKDAVIAQMMDNLSAIDSNFGLVRYNINTMKYEHIFYNLSKVNKKVIRGPRVPKEYEGSIVLTESSTCISQPHWILKAYIVPENMVNGSWGVSIEQKEKHFNIVSI